MEKHTKKIKRNILVCVVFILLILGNETGNEKITTAMAAQISEVTSAATPTKTATAEETISATITFDAKEGMFASENKNKITYTFTNTQIKHLYKKRFYESNFPVPVRDGYVLTGWRRQSDNKKIGNYVTVRNNTNHTYVAQWEPQQYKISYELNGGSLKEQENVPYNYTVESGVIKLPKPVKKGYYFSGWYRNPSLAGKKVTTIAAGSKGTIQVYAKWVSAAPGGVKLAKVKKKNGNLIIQVGKNKSAKGYEISISKNKKFTSKNTAVYDLKSKRKLTISSPAPGTYYIRARAYAYDDQGNVCAGTYSKTKKVVIKGKVKEKKATNTSAKITKAEVLSTKKAVIKATVKNQLKSSDDFYYLMKINPVNNKAETVIQKVVKSEKLVFELDTSDKRNVISKFGIAIKKKGKYKLISSCFYLDNIKKAAKNTSAYLVPSTKKGIHYAVNDYNLDAKYTICNLNVHDVLSTKGKGTPYVYGGETYYFNSVHEELVSEYNKKKINVTMVIYMPWSDKNQFMITPTGREKGHNYYALNTTDKKARNTLEAMFSFLGETYSKKNCYVSNWILGNEINSQKNWNYAGDVNLEEYAASYARAFVMLSNAVQSCYKNARVYIPLDGAWGLHNSQVGWSGRNTLSAVDAAIEKESPDVKWHLAYHAYSVPITGPSYKGNKNMTKSEYSPFIGMKNIEVLTEYIKKNYGEDTSIILSEQGYTVYMGEDKQAASLAYAYYKAEFNSMIDAFIIVRVYDNEEEKAQGLAMGLKELNGTKRKAYDVFKYMDSPQCEKYTKQCLKTIKKKNWKTLIPEYTVKRFKK